MLQFSMRNLVKYEKKISQKNLIFASRKKKFWVSRKNIAPPKS